MKKSKNFELIFCVLPFLFAFAFCVAAFVGSLQAAVLFVNLLIASAVVPLVVILKADIK